MGIQEFKSGMDDILKLSLDRINKQFDRKKEHDDKLFSFKDDDDDTNSLKLTSKNESIAKQTTTKKLSISSAASMSTKISIDCSSSENKECNILQGKFKDTAFNGK